MKGNWHWGLYWCLSSDFCIGVPVRHIVLDVLHYALCIRRVVLDVLYQRCHIRGVISEVSRRLGVIWRHL